MDFGTFCEKVFSNILRGNRVREGEEGITKQ